MIEKIINFLKKIFGKEEFLKIEAPSNSVVEEKDIKDFHYDLKKDANDRIRLLNIQRDIKDGKITEDDLDSKDVNLLKKLYCEQILELANSIELYNKKIKEYNN
ncbi:MAG: hypothetical protein J5507_06710 [Clostridia bacterium]|nr:hypothetical protein [Clostridia bacterium]